MILFDEQLKVNRKQESETSVFRIAFSLRKRATGTEDIVILEQREWFLQMVELPEE